MCIVTSYCIIDCYVFFFSSRRRHTRWSLVTGVQTCAFPIFGLFPMLQRFKTFEYDWEREHLENSRDLIFKNTYKDIETILRQGAENGTRFEFECRSEERGVGKECVSTCSCR